MPTSTSTPDLADQFQVPTYAEAIDCLALGFGLATTEGERLHSAKSWAAMQNRYSPPHLRDGTDGLINELTDILSGGDEPIKKMLALQLNQYEYLLSCLRVVPLFTRKSRFEGLVSFLRYLVFPQVAVLLWRGSRITHPTVKQNDRLRATEIPATTPLYHLAALFRELGDEPDSASVATKKVVKAQLLQLPDKVTKGAKEGLERLLCHLDSRSTPSLKTVDLCCEDLGVALKTELHGDEKVAALHVATTIKAALVAGLAVKRFVEKLRATGGNRDGSSLLTRIGHHYAGLEFPFEHEESINFHAVHAALFDALMEKFPQDPSTVPGFWRYFETVDRLFLQDLGCQSVDQCAPAAKLEKFLRSPSLNRNEFETTLKDLEVHENYRLYDPLQIYFRAFLPLAEEHLEAALEKFKEFLRATKKKQLGSYAWRAATFAIALEVKTRPFIPKGALEALVLQRIGSQAQSVTTTIGMPTVFGDFCRAPSLPVSVQIIFDAIADFNQCSYPVSDGRARIYCNPLERLDSKVGQLLAMLEKPSPPESDRLESIRSFVAKTFNGRKGRSVFSFCKLMPYEALRDVIYYLNRIATQANPVLGYELNQNLCRYLELPEIELRTILEQLDPEAYEKDKINPPLLV